MPNAALEEELAALGAAAGLGFEAGGGAVTRSEALAASLEAVLRRAS